MAAAMLHMGAHIGKGRAAAIRCMVALGFLVVSSSLARAQARPHSPAAPRATYTFQVNVGMVVLHATVRNRKGAPVSGLVQSDFHVLENGVLQPINYFGHNDIPVTAGLVIDNSGSMAPKRAEVIAAALAFARSSNPQDQVFLVNFNERVWFGLPPETPFTDQAGPLEAALSRTIADGETALYDAVAAALKHLKDGNRDEKVLVVISDGGDDASRLKLTQIMALARHSDAIIYALGIYDSQDPDQNPHALKELAKATGGEAFFPRSVKEALPICEQIARDIRNQYTISYVPTNQKRDGTYRAIQLKAEVRDRGPLSVQTRAGYYAAKAPHTIVGGLGSRP